MKTKYISKNRKVLGGAPVIAGTRIPAERLNYLIKQGYTEKNLRKEFPSVSYEKIRGALFELSSLGLKSLSS